MMNNPEQISIPSAKIIKPDTINEPIFTTEAAYYELSPFAKVERCFDWFFKSVMFFCCMMLALLMFGQVIMRYILETPFVGIEEVSILLAVWIYFLGMGYATKKQEHIHGGILSLVVSDPVIFKTVRFFCTIVCIIGACVFGYYASKYALKQIDRGRLSIVMQWPRWVWSVSMFVGFSMMVVYFIIQSVREWQEIAQLKLLRDSNKGSN